jgi:hypothetical protein
MCTKCAQNVLKKGSKCAQNVLKMKSNLLKVCTNIAQIEHNKVLTRKAYGALTAHKMHTKCTPRAQGMRTKGAHHVHKMCP